MSKDQIIHEIGGILDQLAFLWGVSDTEETRIFKEATLESLRESKSESCTRVRVRLIKLLQAKILELSLTAARIQKGNC